MLDHFHQKIDRKFKCYSHKNKQLFFPGNPEKSTEQKLPDLIGKSLESSGKQGWNCPESNLEIQRRFSKKSRFLTFFETRPGKIGGHATYVQSTVHEVYRQECTCKVSGTSWAGKKRQLYGVNNSPPFCPTRSCSIGSGRLQYPSSRGRMSLSVTVAAASNYLASSISASSPRFAAKQDSLLISFTCGRRCVHVSRDGGGIACNYIVPKRRSFPCAVLTFVGTLLRCSIVQLLTLAHRP